MACPRLVAAAVSTIPIGRAEIGDPTAIFAAASGRVGEFFDFFTTLLLFLGAVKKGGSGRWAVATNARNSFDQDSNVALVRTKAIRFEMSKSEHSGTVV